MATQKEHILVQIGREWFSNYSEPIVHFVDDPEANAILNDLIHYPHAFVLACCMDRQTKAERAWLIPSRIKKFYGSFSMERLVDITLNEYKQLFSSQNLHRFPDTMAEVFFKAVQRIHTKYNDDVSIIWSGCPSSASVVFQFLQFEGVGIKIATMAANILARQFKIPFSNYYSIDVSPDVHVKRVMHRLGLVNENADNTMIIYKAREMCPDFPGIIDYSLWEIGRNWCRPTDPNCEDCIVHTDCPYSFRQNPCN